MRNGDYLCLNFAVSDVCYHKVLLFFLMVMWVGGELIDPCFGRCIIFTAQGKQGYRLMWVGLGTKEYVF